MPLRSVVLRLYFITDVSVGNLVRSVNYRICQLASSILIITFTDCNVDYNNLFYLTNARRIAIQMKFKFLNKYMKCYTITSPSSVNL